jgi:hypothetical protein
MLYAVLCYNDEALVGAWSREEEAAVMGRLYAVQEKPAREGRLGPVARLLPTSAATTVRKGREPLVIDGPFAETKEQLLGFYLVDCETLDEAIDFAKQLSAANSGTGGYEIRPLMLFQPGSLPEAERS